MQMIELAYVVDDDEILVMLLQMLMKRNPHYLASSTFQEGQEALDALQTALNQGEQLPKVIFLDLNMPLMDGWQFLAEFEKLTFPQEIPIYIVTSSIDPADIEKAKNIAVVKGYIEKPIADRHLNEVFAQLCENAGETLP